MDVFSIASEVLGDLQLSSGQLGQLRALDYRLLLDRRQSRDSEAGGDDRGVPAGKPPGADDLSIDDAAALRAGIVAEILEMLTPEQRASLDQK